MGISQGMPSPPVLSELHGKLQRKWSDAGSKKTREGEEQ